MIGRQIRTRAVEAIIRFIHADADYAALTNGGTRIFRQPYDEMGGGTGMNPAPRQLHIYAGASRKVPGVGKHEWDRELEVVIEYYGPRDEKPPALGAVSIDDEIDELANRLYVGQVAKSPGRFEDPDHEGRYITVEIRSVSVSMPRIAKGEAAIRRELSVVFFTKESPSGQRPYES